MYSILTGTQTFSYQETLVLQRAVAYEDLAEVALAQLRRMRNWFERPMGVVCGPISNGGLGSKELNITHFERVVDHFIEVKSGGFFSQIPYEEALWRAQFHLSKTDKTVYPKGAGNPLLEGFYRPLFESGNIGELNFIKGWESSDGSVWEHNLAEELGLTINHLDSQLNPVRFGCKNKTTA